MLTCSKVHWSVTLSECLHRCTHIRPPLSQGIEYSDHSSRIPGSLSIQEPLLPTRAITILISLIVNQHDHFGTPHKWTHTVCAICICFLWLNITPVHSWCCIYLRFLLFHCCIVFHYMTTPQFTYSFSADGLLGGFQFWGIPNKAAMGIYVHAFLDIHTLTKTLEMALAPVPLCSRSSIFVLLCYRDYASLIFSHRGFRKEEFFFFFFGKEDLTDLNWKRSE